MSSGAGGPHPDPERLLRLLDQDLSPAEERALGAHLEACEPCRAEFKRVRAASSEYLEFHEHVLKPALAGPPRPWTLDLRATAPRRARLLRFPARWWMAAAAAAAAILLLARLGDRVPQVKAAELLRKASAVERRAPASRAHTIRIQTRRQRWDRPARLAVAAADAPGKDPADSEMRRLFESAGYSWDDPLSAASFAYWHDRLPAKRDAVETTAGAGAAYIIQTMTSANPISQASLTLRAADLHAVTCTLRFGDAETVEMTEIADVEPAPPAGARPVVQPEVKREPVASPAPVRAATAGDELLAVAALHRIGADLGEPIEVKRQGENVVVRASGLDQQRMEQVRAALAGVPVARLESGELTRSESKETERRPGRQADSANPLYAELQSASPDLPDRITESMERLIARAYALRGLARRYPPDIAASLTAPEAAVLGGILHDHLEAAASTAAEVANLLAAILPRAAAASGAGESWQAISLTLPDDARRLDEALNEGRKPGAAQALADFRAGLARLRGLIPQ